MNQKQELEETFKIMPIHSDLLEYWKKNTETEPVKKALRFLFLSNFTLLGKGNTLKYGTENAKSILIERLEECHRLINNVQFANLDFKKFIKSIHYRHDTDKNTAFIYADPPYLGTTNNYSHSFTEQDSTELFDCLIESGCKFAYSEFNHPFILQQAKQRGLNVITIGERQNLKNRCTEILITNYKTQQLQLFQPAATFEPGTLNSELRTLNFELC
jgi:DNA adenine methylase